MNRIAVFLVIIFTASLAVHGQKYSIGFKPSFLIIGAKYTEEPDVIGIKLSKRASYAIGITLRDQINKLIGIKIEPRFMVKGYNIYWGPGDEDIYRNSYLSIPILFYIAPIHNFSFEFGPEISHLFHSKVKPSGSNSFQNNDSSNQKPLEFSLVTGISYSFLKRFDFGVRYGIGLTAYEKGPLIMPDWTGPQVHYKIVQNYFEFYLNTRLLKKTTNN